MPARAKILTIALLTSSFLWGCKGGSEAPEGVTSTPAPKEGEAAKVDAPEGVTGGAAGATPDAPKPETKDPEGDANASRFDEALARSEGALVRGVWEAVGSATHSCSQGQNTYYDGTYLFYAVNERQTKKTVPWLACAITRGLPGSAPITPGDGLLALLQKLSPVEIYVKSPYGVADAMKLTREMPDDADPPFGHYNPEFVRWFVANAIPGAKDDGFRQKTQAVYDTYFKETAQVYAKTYDKIQKNSACYEEQKASYLKAIADGNLGDFIYDPWNWWLTEFDVCDPSEGYNRASEGALILFTPEGMAFSFWVRRDIDGTSALWHEGLVKLRATYEKD